MSIDGRSSHDLAAAQAALFVLIECEGGNANGFHD
jgi:hypothetical protein